MARCAIRTVLTFVVGLHLSVHLEARATLKHAKKQRFRAAG